MTQDEINKMAEALRDQGLTWGQTMFAVSLVLEAIHTEREACAKVCEDLSLSQNSEWQVGTLDCANAIRARGQA